MEEKDNNLPLGLVYKKHTHGGYFYNIIYDKSKLFYEQLVVQGDRETSRGSVLKSSLSDLPSDEECRKQESEVKQGRYPGTNHLPSDKPFLLSEQEFNEFVKNHPATIRQLREKQGIEGLVRVP